MGGAFEVPGNTGPVAEFNVYVDPEAAEEVYGCGIPLTIVPLDVTESCMFTLGELKTRARQSPGVLSDFVVRMTAGYAEYHRQTEGFLGGYLHDPLAVALVADPSLAHSGRFNVEVNLGRRALRGMTTRVRSTQSTVSVVTSVDVPRFKRMFHARIMR